MHDDGLMPDPGTTPDDELNAGRPKGTGAPGGPDAAGHPDGADRSAADARAVITAFPNGPLLVRGDFAIAAEPGADPERPERAVVAQGAATGPGHAWTAGHLWVGPASGGGPQPPR